MVTNKKVHNFKITLPLIALSIPLFAQHSLTTENSCPYETYMRVEGKCLDISQEGLNNITVALGSNSIQKVDREIKQVSQELADLSGELTALDNHSVHQVDRKIEQVNQELANLNQELADLNSKSVPKVDREIKQVSSKLTDLSEKLTAFCTAEQPETNFRSEILESVCQD